MSDQVSDPPMTTLSPEDLHTLTGSVRAAVSGQWPDARVAGADAVDEALQAAWDSLAGLGLSALAQDGAADGLLAVTRQLGRLGCPVPLGDAYVTAVLLDLAGADPSTVYEGSVRPVVHAGRVDGGRVPHLEGLPGATHVAVLDPAAGAFQLHPVVDRVVTPGLAAPAWGEAVVGDGELFEVGVDAVTDALSLLRLVSAARAVGAASQAADLAREHVCVRTQFGRTVGSFQAVSHRVVDCAVAVAAAEALVDDAVRLHLAGDPGWRVAADLAIRYAVDTAPTVQFGAHHSLAAVGYFEEHEAPWLFRRVHADVARCRAIAAYLPSLSARLVEGGEALPEPAFGPEATSLRAEIRAVVSDAAERGLHGDDPELVALLAERGWIAPGLPREVGGLGADPEIQIAINKELEYWAAASFARTAAGMLGPSISQHGTDDQRAKFLPLIATGRLPFYLGYSEPETGSDLAHLRTRAVRDGDTWVVNGQKSWGTGAYRAEWGWLAVRTDPDAKAHAGITIFLFPTSTPGWSFQEYRALSGERSCATFFDDVRIPDSQRIGELHGGWQILTEALVHERVVIGWGTGRMLRLFDELLTLLRGSHATLLGPDGSAVRAEVEGLAARLQAARLLAARSSVSAVGDGGGVADAPMAKIIGSELEEEFGTKVLALLGPEALLEDRLPLNAPRTFEHALRYSIMAVVAGGTNDIQRNLVARALGLPKC